MEEKISALHTFSKITPLEKLNENFTLAECTVCGCGKNRNYSYIGRDVIEQKLDKLSYLPIVAHLIEKEDGNGFYVGGHDYTLDEHLRFKPLTQIVGCVIADSFEFRDIEEYGETVTYLVCKCILYTEHVPELLEAMYSEDVYFSESMEIEVFQSRPLEEDSNYKEILDFNFLKLCLLGLSDNPDYNTEPCFISSKVYSPDEFALDNNEFSIMIENLKKQCPQYFESSEEGGKGMEDNTVSTVIEEPIDGGVATAELAVENEVVATDTADVAIESSEEVSFSATDKQKHKALNEALSGSVERDEEGRIISETFFWIMDFDDSYVYFEKNVYNSEDNSSETYRALYTMSEDGLEATVSDEWERVIARWLTPDEIAQLDALKAEYEALKKFKSERLEAERKAEYDSVLAEFTDLKKHTEYQTICETAYDFESADALRKECYALRGKYSKAPEKANVVVPIQTNVGKTNYVDEFFSRYGKKNK